MIELRTFFVEELLQLVHKLLTFLGILGHVEPFFAFGQSPKLLLQILGGLRKGSAFFEFL